MGTKSRSEILLEEKVDQIDDVNFDRVYDLSEIADKELDNFDSQIIIDDLSEIDSKKDDVEFSLELQPNEFLDNFKIDNKKEVEKPKSKLARKPLFFAFTSIVALLCILFVYNMFVINSLEFRAGQAFANSTISSSNEIESNDDITFENNNTTHIEKNLQLKEVTSQTNWFDRLIQKVNQLFGGNY